MKTVDLIPFILLELNEQDQYGLELSKAIEIKTNGQIIIKQPTLYTILKKLEKSKFIASYWQDSEIGGKRHYYKLTEFGKIQVSTLPSYAELVNSLNEENAENNDSLLEKTTISPVEAVVPTEEVFSMQEDVNYIDNATEADINYKNLEILKDEDVQKEQVFAGNENVAKFTENSNVTSPVNITELQNNASNNILPILDEDNSNVVVSSEIKFVEYKNIKKEENFIYSKNIAKKFTIKSIFISLAMLSILTLLAFVTNITGTSKLYYIVWICALIFSIFYPIITALNLEKIKQKYYNKKFVPNYKQDIVNNVALVVITFLIVLIINVAMGINSFSKIFSANNFANLYAPLILSCIGFISTIIKFILFKKNK